MRDSAGFAAFDKTKQKTCSWNAVLKHLAPAAKATIGFD